MKQQNDQSSHVSTIIVEKNVISSVAVIYTALFSTHTLHSYVFDQNVWRAVDTSSVAHLEGEDSKWGEGSLQRKLAGT